MVTVRQSRRTSRLMLIEHFAKRGYTRGAEIGVREAAFSREMCRRIPGIELLCVDPWLDYPSRRRQGAQRKQEACYRVALERLAPYFANVRIWRMFSVEAAKRVKNGSLDFVYIDANHEREHVTADLEAWVPKVRSGGVVSGDDYDPADVRGVAPAVLAYAESAGIELVQLTSEPNRRRQQPTTGRAWNPYWGTSWWWDQP